MSPLTGDLCGSVYLDQGFDRYIRRTLGDAAIDKMRPRARAQMQQSFERAKIRFGNTNDRFFEVNVPGLPDNDLLRIEDGYHSMNAADLQAIFDPVVDRIVRLVKDQVEELQMKGKTVAVSRGYLI